MVWNKLGLVYVPTGKQDWIHSHAFIPTSTMLTAERLRVYAAFLDANKVGRIGFIDLDASNPLRILGVSEFPALDIGEPGTFDDNGVAPLCVLEHEGRILMYYLGFQLGVKVRYTMFAGLAVSADGGHTFQRHSRVPVLDRSDRELFVRSAAYVHHHNDRWRMWYVAGDRWIEVHGKQVPTYNLRYLESPDGVTWGKEGTVCLDLHGQDEFGFGRPFVIQKDGRYNMWYSIRTISKGYRIGYAESQDGLNWVRKDSEVGIDVSETGWDSQMICFACVQETKYGTYMFYNGNNFGETGFGVAVLKS